MKRIEQIISGGQTAADRAAFDWRSLNIAASRTSTEAEIYEKTKSFLKALFL